MMRWQPLPERQPGEVLRDINFRVERDTERVLAQFRHRDNRVWSAQIDPFTHVEMPQYHHSVQLSSGGCRSYQFVCRSLQKAKSVVLRFSNLDMQFYERLVADAHGTTDHPRGDDIGVFRMSVVKQRRAGWGGHRTETNRYSISGLGRVDGNSITLFPTSEEISEILLEVCDHGSNPLVPQGINELDPNRFRRTALDDTEIPELDEDEVAAALDRSFHDDVDAAVTGLAEGTYATPRAREERDIDLGFGDD